MTITENVIFDMQHNCITSRYSGLSSNVFPKEMQYAAFYDVFFTYGFIHKSQDYYIVCGYKYLDYILDEEHFQAMCIEYRVQDTSDGAFGFEGQGYSANLNGMEYFIKGFDSNSSEFKAFLKMKMIQSGFPEDLAINLLHMNLSEGVNIYKIKPLFVCDRIKIIDDKQTITDYTAVVLPEVDHTTALRGLTSSKKVALNTLFDDNINDLRNNFYSYNKETHKLLCWFIENTSGNIYIYGSIYKFKILFFENKCDALLYKMTYIE